MDGPSDSGIGASLANVTAADNRWMLKRLIRPLNRAVAGTATHGWHVASGIEELARAHGYCTDDPWFNTPRASWELQDDFFGTAHPNAASHEAYRDVLRTVLGLQTP